MSDSTRYRILLLNWQDIRHPLGGGAELYHQEILKRLAARGHPVTLLCSGYKGLSREEVIDGIRVVRVGERNLFNYVAPFACRRLLSEETFDVVIDSLNKIPLLSPLYVTRTPVIALVHHLFRKAIFREVAFPMAAYVYGYEKFIGPVYRRVPFIAVSESTKQDVIASGIPPDHIAIIENCVDHDRYRTTPAPKSDVPTVGYLGRIKRYKSVDHLIRAFAIVKQHIPEAQLVIVGSGDNLNELKELAYQLGLIESVAFPGFLSEEDKVAVLQRCHVTVNPSVKEGWGLTVIESNACGTPTVAANVPGLRDSVRHEETGLLYPYGDIAACAAHIERVLTDTPYRTRLSEAAVRWAGKFHWSHAADRTLEVIAGAIAEFPGR